METDECGKGGYFMIKDRRLGHLGMASRDVDATVAWYVDVLGFEKIGEFKAPNGNDIKFIRNKEGCIYEIFPRTVKMPVPMARSTTTALSRRT